MQFHALPGVRHDPSTDDSFHLRRTPGKLSRHPLIRPVGPSEKVVYTTKRPVLLIKPKEVLAAHLDEGEVFAGAAR